MNSADTKYLCSALEHFFPRPKLLGYHELPGSVIKHTPSLRGPQWYFQSVVDLSSSAEQSQAETSRLVLSDDETWLVAAWEPLFALFVQTLNFPAGRGHGYLLLNSSSTLSLERKGQIDCLDMALRISWTLTLLTLILISFGWEREHPRYCLFWIQGVRSLSATRGLPWQ